MTTSITARYPQRVAWATLLTAFVTFCLLMAGIAWAINWVLFDSTIDLRTTVKVSRGTIGYTAPNDTERVVRDRYPVQTGDTLRTDELSQGYITIADPLNDDHVLATIQMFGGSSLVLNRASRPRFGLGDNPYSILIDDAVGKLDIVITPHLERELRLQIRDTQGEYQVRLDQSGYYSLQFGVDGVRVIVRRGKALVIDGEDQAKLIEKAPTTEVWFFEKGETPVVESLLVDLLDNPDFDQVGAADDVAVVWICGDDLPAGQTRIVPDVAGISDPPGTHERTFFQDRFTLHLRRTGNEPVSPRDTRCWQPAYRFAVSNESNLRYIPVGNDRITYIDVSEYDSLYIRATIYISSQSIAACGVAGTECAVMLKMPFKNARNIDAGTESEWIQGFYVNYAEGTNALIRCANCSRDHEHVNPNSWYTFESDDFVADLPLDQQDLRPIWIREIQVYSSGHLYDAYIGELALIAVKRASSSVEP
ncbi:MAG: hypothetical protein DPW16_19850 [Chloroflexi bacterium]|nr:hypothetical protein [Chloroflexota bacterium]